MRVISGKLRNKSIITKHTDRKNTRPVTAIVRKSLFSCLGDIKGKIVLDLFCGTGILGIEAISRGSKSALFIDKDKNNTKHLKENLKHLKLQDITEIYNTDYRMALKALKRREQQFDIIFVDPPYKWVAKFQTLNYIIKYDILKAEGIIVHNMDKHTVIDHEEFETIKQAVFGKTCFVFLRRKSDGSNLSGNI